MRSISSIEKGNRDMRATAQAAAGQSRACIRAARRFKRRERGPLFLSEWERALFVHFRVPPGRLQTQVPFELDLLDGWAHVSLVAFEMRDLRLSFAGKLGRLLTVPGATHGLLNVRTYVTYRGEPGIHFMMEWIPNRLSILIGPRTYGLPYRFGRLEYDHDHEIGTVRGTVTPGGARGRLQYRATLPPSARYAVAEAGSMGDFLL